MLKSLMTASALVALIAAGPAMAQSNDATAPAASGDQVKPLPLGTDNQPAAGAEMKAPADNTQAATPEVDTTKTVAETQTFIGEQVDGQMLASSVIGQSVYDSDGNDLGTVNDIVLNEEGGIDAVVIGVGGFLGIGQKNVAVSMDAIDKTTDADGNPKFVLAATKEQLDAAPGFLTLADIKAKQEQDLQAQQPAAGGGMGSPTPAPAQ